MDEDLQIRVRMRQSLRDALDKSARTSLNAEIVRRLQASFHYEQRLAEEIQRNKEFQELLRRMADALERVLDELTVMTIKEMRDAIRDARQASAQVVEVGLAKETDVSGESR
jgi:fructose-1,6-bisphosphatase/sedoheptulose 1,7-bisphosphatase-like protein